MSLYDLFEHTQFLIVPPAPDNWSDWHFYIKTFGPGIIAGCIASMALKVALTQREIAANKYDLDLFDKRYDIFENFISCHDKIIEIDIIRFDSKIKEKFDNDEISEKEITDIHKKQFIIIRDFIEKDLSSVAIKLEKASRIFGKIDKERVRKFKNKIAKFSKDKDKFIKSFIINDMDVPFAVILYSLNSKGNKICVNNEIKKHEENISLHYSKIKELEKNIEEAEDELTKTFARRDIEEHKKTIKYEKKEIENRKANFEYSQRTYRENNAEIQNLIESMYSLKSEFLKMYNIMDTYLSIKEDAYKKKRGIIPLNILFINIIIFTFIYNKD